MTQTDRLRAMLDERGVEWTAVSKDATMDNQTYCYPHTFTEFQDGLMVTNLTPEQAIAATLGAGTCRNVSDPPEGFLCSECGWGDFAEPSHLLTGSCYAGLAKGPRYCPNCGRKVES